MKLNMKKRVIYCALFCLLAPASVVLAQDNADDDTPPPPPPPMNCQQVAPPQMGMPPMGPQMCGMGMQQGFGPQMRPPQMGPRPHKGDMLKRLKEDLNLTDEQVKAMKELHQTMAKKRQEAVKKAMESVKAQGDAELKKILTKEQYKEFTEKQEKMHEHMKECAKDSKGPRRGFGPPPPCDQDKE